MAHKESMAITTEIKTISCYWKIKNENLLTDQLCPM